MLLHWASHFCTVSKAWHAWTQPENHAMFQRQEYSNVLLLEKLILLAYCSRDAWGWDEAVLATDLTAAACYWSKQKNRQLLFVPSRVPSPPLHEKKYHFLPFLPFNAVSELGCKSTVKPSAAEPNVIVSSSTGLIPFNISHSSTGSSNTVSLCLGMHSGLPHSLYVACWKWASAQNPALPWLSAPPHNTHIPLVHRRASPLPSITYRQKLSPTELLPRAELPPRGIPRDLINPNFSDKTFEVLIHRCDKQPASLWMKPADKAQLQSNKNHPDSQATGKGFCLRLP